MFSTIHTIYISITLVLVLVKCERNHSGLSNVSISPQDLLENDAYSWADLVDPKAANEVPNLRMETPCITPNCQRGYCMEIQKCGRLLRELTNSDALSFLRASRCGPRNENPKKPKVCCGEHGNYIKNNKISCSVDESENVPALKENPLPKKCGIQNITTRGRIFGGSEARLGEFPWIVRLVHRNDAGEKSFGCVGFLIHARNVLTAGHCIVSDSIAIRGSIYSVLLGEHNVETQSDCTTDKKICADPPVEIKVGEATAHPLYDKYSRDHLYDIGILHLKKSAKFSNFIQPICLPENRIEAMEYSVSGWGQTEHVISSSIKMRLNIYPYDHVNCTQKYKTLGLEVKKHQICAGGEENKDSCAGDSGGPLMAFEKNKWYGAGVVSYGIGCGRKDWPAIYTDVSSYIEWIKEQIRKHGLNKKSGNTAKGERNKSI